MMMVLNNHLTLVNVNFTLTIIYITCMVIEHKELTNYNLSAEII